MIDDALEIVLITATVQDDQFNAPQVFPKALEVGFLIMILGQRIILVINGIDSAVEPFRTQHAVEDLLVGLAVPHQVPDFAGRDISETGGQDFTEIGFSGARITVDGHDRTPLRLNQVMKGFG